MRPQLHRSNAQGTSDRDQEFPVGSGLLCDGTDEQDPISLQGGIIGCDRGADRAGTGNRDTFFDALIDDQLPGIESPAPTAAVKKRKLPTQRSLELLRNRGYLVAVVERWNQHAGIRQDLFGFVDVLALRDGETLAVQATSSSNVSAHVQKIANHPHVDAVRKSGWRIVVHGWVKRASGRWEVREVDCS